MKKIDNQFAWAVITRRVDWVLSVNFTLYNKIQINIMYKV